MNVRRALGYVVLGCVALVGLSTPAAAQSVNRALIDELNEQLLYVALPLALLVEVILIYAVIRFRDNDDPKPTAEDPVLEITWTSATAVILLFAGLSAYVVLGNPYIAASSNPTAGGPADVSNPSNGAVVNVTAYQWNWQMEYPAANVTTTALLVLPNGTDVQFRLRSRDVIHSLFIPAFGVKQDAFPGQYTTARTRPTKLGTYRLYCAEFCGAGHSRMQGTVRVVRPAVYRQWLRSHRGERNVTQPPNATGTSP